jgi:uncharacterized membrane protein YjgN (DUF898 family)
MDSEMSPTPTPRQRLEIRFVGSGSEYFRIWIVNLLLTLVTLGFYYPFAKVRRLRYFHAATEVGGHALSFHGQPWKMLRGYLLVGVLFAAYAVAGQVSPTAGLVALVILACVWPALWHASLRFRLANTGWRGLRARFTGRRGGAYAALLPMFVYALYFGLVGVLARPEAGAAPAPPRGGLLVMAALAPVVVCAGLPLLLWLLKRYQHGHYALAGESSRFTVRLSAAYGLGLRGFGLMVVAGLGLGIVLAGLFAALRGLVGGDAHGGPPGIGLTLLPLLVMFVLLQGLVSPYFVSRVQNLLWAGTRSEHLAFESRLRFRSLALLTLKNWCLVLLTLGLYFPFAAVATARLRLQAVTLVASLDLDTLWADRAAEVTDASGDAAADLLGIDIGL